MFSNFSRRQLLKLLGGLIAGATAVGSIPFLGRFFASGAQAQQGPNDNAADRAKYKAVKTGERKGRSFEVRTKVKDETPRKIPDTSGLIDNPYDEPVELYVDGKKVDMVRNRKTNKYETVLLPFHNDFESPEALAEEMIDLQVVVPTVELQVDGEYYGEY